MSHPDGRRALQQKKREPQMQAELSQSQSQKKMSAAALVASSLSPAQVARRLQQTKAQPTATGKTFILKLL